LTHDHASTSLDQEQKKKFPSYDKRTRDASTDESQCSARGHADGRVEAPWVLDLGPQELFKDAAKDGVGLGVGC